MTTTTEKLADSLRAMIDLAEQEVASLHELGRDDEDTEAQADEAQVSLDAARATLAEYEASKTGSDAYPDGTRVVTVESGDDRVQGGLQGVLFTPNFGFWPTRDNRKGGGFFWVRLSRDGSERCLPGHTIEVLP